MQMPRFTHASLQSTKQFLICIGTTTSFDHHFEKNITNFFEIELHKETYNTIKL